VVNTTKRFNITAQEPDDDVIRFDVTGLPQGAVMTTNGSTVFVLWNVTMDQV